MVNISFFIVFYKYNTNEVNIFSLPSLCKQKLVVEYLLFLPPFVSGKADVVNTLSFPPDKWARGVDSIRLIYTKTNK